MPRHVMSGFGNRLNMQIGTLVNPLLCLKHWRSPALLFTLMGRVVPSIPFFLCFFLYNRNSW